MPPMTRADPGASGLGGRGGEPALPRAVWGSGRWVDAGRAGVVPALFQPAMLYADSRGGAEADVRGMLISRVSDDFAPRSWVVNTETIGAPAN
jgi:hypothetical protein